MSLISKNNKTVCDLCQSSFTRFADLRRHLKRYHPESLDTVAPLQLKNYAFTCSSCPRNFSCRRNLKFHMKTHGSSDSEMNSPRNIKCPLCDFAGRLKNELDGHFKSAHDIVIETEKIKFETSEEFKGWLAGIEKDTKSKFVKENGATGRKLNYICHRSGWFRPRGAGKRPLKIKGSKKIEGFCPARVNVVIGKDGIYKTHFVKTHVGHENELVHLFLTSEERSHLAAQISAKVPFDAILDSIHDDVSDSCLERMHLVNRKDLFNIERCFNLKSRVVDAEDKREECKVVFELAQSLDKDSISLAERKEWLIEEHIKIFNSINSNEELNFVQKIISSVGSTLQTMRHLNQTKSSIPHNPKVFIVQL